MCASGNPAPSDIVLSEGVVVWECVPPGNSMINAIFRKSSTSCFAIKKSSSNVQNIGCGTASGVYPQGSSNFRSNNFCASDYTLVGSAPKFGNVAVWSCKEKLSFSNVSRIFSSKEISCYSIVENSQTNNDGNFDPIDNPVNNPENSGNGPKISMSVEKGKLPHMKSSTNPNSILSRTAEINLGDSVKITYTVSGALSCYGTSGPGASSWDGKKEHTNGVQHSYDVTPNSKGTNFYRLFCEDSSGKSSMNFVNVVVDSIDTDYNPFGGPATIRPTALIIKPTSNITARVGETVYLQGKSAQAPLEDSRYSYYWSVNSCYGKTANEGDITRNFITNYRGQFGVRGSTTEHQFNNPGTYKLYFTVGFTQGTYTTLSLNFPSIEVTVK